MKKKALLLMLSASLILTGCKTIKITIEDDDFIEGKVHINRIDNKKKKKTVHNSKVLNSYDDSVLLKDYYKKIEKK